MTTSPDIKLSAIFPDSLSFNAAVVIGGAGMIGSRLVADLRARDIPVVVLDDFSRRDPAGMVAVSGKLELMAGSAIKHSTVIEAIRRAVAMSNDDSSYPEAVVPHVAVFLLAAYVSNGSMTADQYRVNACAPLVVAAALGDLRLDLDFKIKTSLVFASSFAVYGSVPWNDARVEKAEHHVRPLTDYGKSKRDAECAIRVVAANSGYPNYVMLRFSNVIGASERVGEIVTADPFAGLTAHMIRSRKPITISCHPRATKDGATWRNFIDVRDISAALMHAANYAAEPRGEHVFNVCVDKPRPIVDLVTAAGVPYVQEDLPPTRGDVDYSHGDNERFKKVCAPGWYPRFTLQDSADAIAARRAIVQGR